MDSSTQSGPNYYEALGLTPEASEDDIRSAFKALNRKQRERDRELLDEARRTSIAFETLRDQARRTAYDASLGRAPEQKNGSVTERHPRLERSVDYQSQLQPVTPQRELASARLGRPGLAGNASGVLTVGRRAYVLPRERSHSWMAVAGVVLGAVLILPFMLWQNSGNGHRNPASLPEPNLPNVIRDPLAEDETFPSGLLPDEPAVLPSSPERSEALPKPHPATQRTPRKAASDTVRSPAKAAKPKKANEPPLGRQKKKEDVASNEKAAKSPQKSARPTVKSEDPSSTGPEAIRRAVPPRWIVGGLTNSDNRGGRFAGTVSVRFTVKPSGQVGNCRPVASSGNPALDARTCRLLEQRLLYSPALDSKGRPVAAELRTTYVWRRGGR